MNIDPAAAGAHVTRCLAHHVTDGLLQFRYWWLRHDPSLDRSEPYGTTPLRSAAVTRLLTRESSPVGREIQSLQIRYPPLGFVPHGCGEFRTDAFQTARRFRPAVLNRGKGWFWRQLWRRFCALVAP
ncbi:hypothetical protein RGUI_4096 [Rhodovulum sp. P5]|nr:hypothetical protein RGUI_4096 [Rhodovulum sp. P5]